MKRVLFLYSGEGTNHEGSSYKLVKISQYWARIEGILRDQLGLELEALWSREMGKHRAPYSPLLTVVCQICLSDLWERWGYHPDSVVGHSLGELAAAFQAGFYSLEQVLRLALQIGQVAARLDGLMLHGILTDEQIQKLPVTLSSLNFGNGDGKHVTLSGYPEEMKAFLESHPGFTEMRPPHPWHHRDYARHLEGLEAIPARTGGAVRFVSGVSAAFLPELPDDYWKRWLSQPIDFIGAMEAIRREYPDDELEVVEIGFHPVLEKSCEVFPAYRYASSMYRGEEEKTWILFQRRKLDPQPFLSRLRQEIDRYRPGLDFDAPLAYEGFSSLQFVEFAGLLEPLFPGLAPQDFYRFKTVRQLIERFGAVTASGAPRTQAPDKQEVVIAGMSCRFPASVQNPAQFWRLLLGGEDQVRPDPQRGDFQAGFLGREVTKFDYKYFRISEAEARAMDPQQMLALELAEQLWRDAGIDPESLNKKRVGVYLGVWNEEYRGDRASVYYPTGTNPSIVASRISYHYDLRGPSWVSNTACSSSLLAVHYACKDIEAGRIDYAIAGGVNMILGDSFTDSMRRSGFLSKNQRCKVFDDSADGYVRAEGGGLVLLANRKLAARCYAVVRGSAVNQNGRRAQVITAPHPEAQEELILDACQDAGIEPGQIAYVECHGTGTRIGDPIEISALQNTVGRNRKDTCYLGSVKSNIGHLESAAGIAGLIKAVLALHHSTIPPNLHFETPNQFIDFASHRLRVVAEKTALAPLAIAGVSSFGFGGSNAHVILSAVEEPSRKAVEDLPSPFDRSRALPLSEYFLLEQEQAAEALGAAAGSPSAPPKPRADSQEDLTGTVGRVFRQVTSIEAIDPELDLTEQGLDSMSAMQFLLQLESELHVSLEADVLLDHPRLPQLVDCLRAKRTAVPG
jgi:3-oxoacyl-(acyl-carrier-protein) synthase/acyl carrier protein